MQFRMSVFSDNHHLRDLPGPPRIGPFYFRSFTRFFIRPLLPPGDRPPFDIFRTGEKGFRNLDRLHGRDEMRGVVLKGGPLRNHSAHMRLFWTAHPI